MGLLWIDSCKVDYQYITGMRGYFEPKIINGKIIQSRSDATRIYNFQKLINLLQKNTGTPLDLSEKGFGSYPNYTGEETQSTTLLLVLIKFLP